MRIFLAGATGAIGTRLLPMLKDAGHEVSATTRSPGRADRLSSLGAQPVVMDGLDAESVKAAVTDAKPDVVIHEMTALSGPPDMKHFDRWFAATNELRTRGTDHLLAAARAAGTPRFIAQSFTGWPYERSGTATKDESAPLDPRSTAPRTVEAIRYVEQAVTSASDLDGLVLRYGGFYGPGNALGEGGDMLEMVKKRRFPIVGGGEGVWSFVHIHDAAAATLRAVETGAPGLYNVVDDDPAPVREWLPYLAEVLGAPRPLSVPAWLARPMIGAHGISMMTKVRGAKNGKARAELGWQPRYPSWRQGFRDGLA